MTSPFPEGSTRAHGYLAESYAAEFLRKQGLEICARNVTIAGVEIDLIAHISAHLDPPQDTFVFVEVRSREDDRHGSPLETIQSAKIARLKRGATAWLIAHDLWEEVAVRFDVISVVDDEIQWIQGAFDVD